MVALLLQQQHLTYLKNKVGQDRITYKAPQQRGFSAAGLRVFYILKVMLLWGTFYLKQA